MPFLALFGLLGWLTVPELAAASTTAFNTSKSCVEFDDEKWGDYVSDHRIETQITVTSLFQTIESFGPSTTIYTPGDGIPHLQFLAPPTRSQHRNVTVVKTLTLRTVPREEEEKSKFWTTFPCSTSELPNCSRNAVIERLEAVLGFKGPSDSSDTSTDIQYDLKWDAVARCDISIDEEVILFHWPSESNESVVSDLQTPVTVVTSAITFRGQDIYPYAEMCPDLNYFTTRQITYLGPQTLTGPFTFTSPTLYIAHSTIGAELSYSISLNSKGEPQCSETSMLSVNLRTAGILSVVREQVSSLAPRQESDPEYPSLVAHGLFQPGYSVQDEKFDYMWRDRARGKWKTLWGGAVGGEPRAINFDDFRYPIPASAYFDARSEDCWGAQSHCRTVTDDNFRPRLVLGGDVWHSLIRTRTDMPRIVCRHALLADPPILLRPITSASLAVPTIPIAQNMPVITPPTVADPSMIHHLPVPGLVPAAPFAEPTGSARAFKSTGGRKNDHNAAGDRFEEDGKMYSHDTTGNDRVGNSGMNGYSAAGRGKAGRDRDGSRGNGGNINDGTGTHGGVGNGEDDADPDARHSNNGNGGLKTLPSVFTGGSSQWAIDGVAVGTEHLVSVLLVQFVLASFFNAYR